MFIIQQSCRLCTRNTRMISRITRNITPPRRLLEIPTFLRNLTEYIDIKTFFILYAFFLSEHRYIFSKKAR